MIVVDAGKLQYLLRGRPIQVDVDERHRKNRVVEVARPPKNGRDRPAIHRARVLDVFRMNDDLWRLTLSLQVDERPRLLRARLDGRDYTDRTDLAARGEPEALSEQDLEWFAGAARMRDDLRGSAERAERPRSARVAALEAAAAAGDQHAKRHLFVIDQRIDAHERGASRGA